MKVNGPPHSNSKFGPFRERGGEGGGRQRQRQRQGREREGLAKRKGKGHSLLHPTSPYFALFRLLYLNAPTCKHRAVLCINGGEAMKGKFVRGPARPCAGPGPARPGPARPGCWHGQAVHARGCFCGCFCVFVRVRVGVRARACGCRR